MRLSLSLSLLHSMRDFSLSSSLLTPPLNAINSIVQEAPREREREVSKKEEKGEGALSALTVLPFLLPPASPCREPGA